MELFIYIVFVEIYKLITKNYNVQMFGNVSYEMFSSSSYEMMKCFLKEKLDSSF